MLQVDMKDVIAKKAESTGNDLRTRMRDKDIRHSGISRDKNNVEIKFRDMVSLNKAKDIAQDQLVDYEVSQQLN